MIQTLLFSMPGGSEWLLIILAFLAWWIYAIVEIATSKFKDNGNKTVWLLVVIFLGFIGTLIYWFAGRSNRLQVK